MPEIKNVGYAWMAKCNQLIHLLFKGLIKIKRRLPGEHNVCALPCSKTQI